MGLASLGTGAGCAERPPVHVEVVDLDGLEARMHLAKPGVPLLVNYWATWCAPCVAELPELAEVARDHREAEVLAVSLDLALPYNPAVKSADAVGAFARDRDLNLPFLLLEGATAEELGVRLGLPSGIPYTIALDRSGKVVDTQEGSATRERFEEMLAAAQR